MSQFYVVEHIQKQKNFYFYLRRLTDTEVYCLFKAYLHPYHDEPYFQISINEQAELSTLASEEYSARSRFIIANEYENSPAKVFLRRYLIKICPLLNLNTVTPSGTLSANL